MSKTSCYFHIVFGTKFRQKTIFPDRKSRLYQYIASIIKNKKSELIIINGVENHIHILMNLHPTVALADMVRDIKSNSSKMIQQTFCLPMFEGWAKEYFASSVSPAHVDAVKTYIENQEAHHKTKEFESEIMDFAAKMGMTLYEGDLD